MAKIFNGRIVLFGFPTKDGGVAERPAIVVRAWSDSCANLSVFVDGENDRDLVNEFELQPVPNSDRKATPLTVWRTSVTPADDQATPQAFRWRELAGT